MPQNQNLRVPVAPLIAIHTFFQKTANIGVLVFVTKSLWFTVYEPLV